MAARSLNWQFWLRMVIAGVAGIIGVVTLVAFEFVMAGLPVVSLLFALEMPGFRLLLGLVPVVLALVYFVWLGIAVGAGWDSDGRVGQPHPAASNLPLQIGVTGAIAVLLIGGHHFLEGRSELVRWVVIVAASAVMVGWLQYRLLVDVFDTEQTTPELLEG